MFKFEILTGYYVLLLQKIGGTAPPVVPNFSGGSSSRRGSEDSTEFESASIKVNALPQNEINLVHTWLSHQGPWWNFSWEGFYTLLMKFLKHCTVVSFFGNSLPDLKVISWTNKLHFKFPILNFSTILVSFLIAIIYYFSWSLLSIQLKVMWSVYSGIGYKS